MLRRSRPEGTAGRERESLFEKVTLRQKPKVWLGSELAEHPQEFSL